MFGAHFDPRPPLPAGWQLRTTPFGQPYYVNMFTGQTAPFEAFAPPGAVPPPVHVVHHAAAPAVHVVHAAPAPEPAVVVVAASPKAPAKKAFVKVASNPGTQDKAKAHGAITAYQTKVKKLSDKISEYINPNSKANKSIADRIKLKTGSSKLVKLETHEKNEILSMARELLQGLDMFLFDFTKFGKTLPEREFSQVMLVIKQFKENVARFQDVVVKSETIKECLNKIRSKFESSINVSFEQKIDYQNTGAQSVDFSNHETIQDHSQTIFGVNDDPDGNYADYIAQAAAVEYHK
jgi:hypothetical protein